jgi:hypothetical protein
MDYRVGTANATNSKAYRMLGALLGGRFSLSVHLKTARPAAVQAESTNPGSDVLSHRPRYVQI